MPKNQMLDAQQALSFAVQQSAVINPRLYAKRYPDYDFGRLVYVNTEIPEWAGSYQTFLMDSVGKADWYSGYAKDIPLADTNLSSVTKNFDLAAVGYQWNLEELGKAQFMNIPLDTRRAAAARQAYVQFMWNLTIFGATEKNLPGLANFPGVTTTTFPADGTGASTLWANKTPAQIVRDINLLLTGIFTTTLETEMADTLLLPFEAMVYLAQTPYSTTTMDTILSFVQKTNVYTLQTGRPLTIRSVRGLENAGTSTLGRVIAYKNDRDYVELLLPIPHRFLDVYQDGPLNYVVPGIFRTGGIDVYNVSAIRYGDGSVA